MKISEYIAYSGMMLMIIAASVQLAGEYVKGLPL